MRKKKLALNTLSSLLLQIVSIICGFILPRLIIGTYGSEVNGLVNSITQFISFIAFLELGIGAVIQSGLYKPLAYNDTKKVSEIVVSGQKFYTFIARVLIIYIIFLIILYPIIVNKEFDWIYTASLIVIISISSFSQYYFGVVNALLITADQSGYVQYFLSAFTLFLNTVASAILIYLGFGIHTVKFVASIIFVFKPIFLSIYVKKHYNIDRKIKYEKEPIEQKWNGIAQHIAAVILSNTDTVVLSVFSTLSNVSVYSVYYLVISGVKRVFDTMTNGVMALMGELWAKQEIEELKRLFSYTEWIMHTATVFVFGCISVLICPFVAVYTKGVTDVEYIVPVFAILLTIAHAAHCLRMPYNIMILAGNHYKQTQSNYIVAAVLNLGISILTVHLWGLVGVAIGTLVAMVYQTVWMAVYISKNFINWPLIKFVKQLLVDILSFIIAYLITFRFDLKEITYMEWFILALKTSVIWFVVLIIINYIFYRDNLNSVISKIRRKKI